MDHWKKITSKRPPPPGARQTQRPQVKSSVQMNRQPAEENAAGSKHHSDQQKQDQQPAAEQEVSAVNPRLVLRDYETEEPASEQDMSTQSFDSGPILPATHPQHSENVLVGTFTKEDEEFLRNQMDKISAQSDPSWLWAMYERFVSVFIYSLCHACVSRAFMALQTKLTITEEAIAYRRSMATLLRNTNELAEQWGEARSAAKSVVPTQKPSSGASSESPAEYSITWETKIGRV
jgi:hypothetical protein